MMTLCGPRWELRSRSSETETLRVDSKTDEARRVVSLVEAPGLLRRARALAVPRGPEDSC